MSALDALTLSQLADKRELLDDELFFSDGVLSPEQERRFDAIAGTADTKIEHIGLLVCHTRALVVGVDFEEERLADRKRAFLKDIERRMEYLRLQMQRLGKRKVVGALCTVTLHRNSTVSITTVAPTTTTGPQSDLFARGRVPHRRAERGQHVRVK